MALLLGCQGVTKAFGAAPLHLLRVWRLSSEKCQRAVPASAA